MRLEPDDPRPWAGFSTVASGVARLLSMADENPNPLSDAVKGLGLLLRAARTAARKLPTKDLEEAVTTSAREVGRAIESVATTIERSVRGRKEPPPPSGDSAPPGSAPRDSNSHGGKPPG
jgi:hypothetical protein